MTELTTQSQQDIAHQALSTINPEQYVEAVYAPFKTRAQQAIESVKGIEYDITTTAGMEIAKKSRALFRDIRLDSEKERKARKEPILVIGKLLEAGNKAVEEQVEPYENKFDSDIKAEEKRKEDIKAEEIRKEAERVAKLEELIESIKNAPLQAVNLDSVGTQEVIERLSIIVPTAEVYQERTVEAEILLEQTLKTLEQMADGKRAQEQLALQQKQVAEESMRVSNIKQAIANIKNYIIDAAEIEQSSALAELVEKVKSIHLGSDVYGEFLNEATTAKETVLKALERQLLSLKSAEQQVTSEPGAHHIEYMEAQADQRAKPQVEEREDFTLSVQDQVSQSQSSPPDIVPDFLLKKPLPTKIWIESDFFGARHVVMQHEGYEPFRYATFNYDYAYTSNSNTMAQAEKLAKELGAAGAIEHRFMTPNAEVVRL